MEGLQELIPFARELLSQKPSRGLLKVYLVGSVCTLLGSVIGLLEAVCHPFSSGEPMDAEMLFLLAREQKTLEAEARSHCSQEQEEEEEEEEEDEGEEEEEKTEGLTSTEIISKAPVLSQRSRLHAS